MTDHRRYYAVPDPDDPNQMTYWRDSTRGEGFMAWPPKVRYGPVLYRRDVPKDRQEQRLVVEQHWAREREWHQQVREAIEADPITAAKRFAEFTSRCCLCGRTLTDEASKVYGIGPECRRGLPHEVLANHFAPQISSLHRAAVEPGPAGTDGTAH